MRSPFLDRLASPVPILFDGAMGTQLCDHGAHPDRNFEELNLRQPDLVQTVHRAYIAAGAEVIATNTFSANHVALARYGLADRVRDINFSGVRLARDAREVSGQAVFLAGSVSSIGEPLAPTGTIPPSQARAVFVEQIEALLEAGVDLLLLETFASLAELREAVLAAQSVSADLPIVAEISVAEDGHTLSGASPEETVAVLDSLGVAALGVNCGVGPQAALDALKRLAPLTACPLSAMPNAGYPALANGRLMYASSPDYFAEYARRFVAAGARLVGGCCGTSPRHIAAMRAALAQPTLPSARATFAVAHQALPREPVGAVAADAPSPLARKLQEDRFIISVEVDPPRGLNPRKMLEGAALIQAAGADCVDIGDSPMARVRMGCLAFGALCEQQVGIETLIHFTTRDRNLMALQSDLLGAHACGLRNIIALTGDPPRPSSYPAVTGVWDVDSVGFIKMLKQLNRGLDWADNSIGRPTQFLVACAVNPMAADLDLEIDRYHQKVAAGADFAITQPLYDLAQLQRFFDRVPPPRIPTVVEIMPLQSYKHAEFCHNELAGVVIPDHLLETMRGAGDRGMQVGYQQAQVFLNAVFPLVQGVLFVPSFHRYEMVGELVRETVALRSRSSTPLAAPLAR